jgi:aryl-alcohol dehydrogenase-like predicted oxidoreductase
MKRRHLGKTGLLVSELALGTWGLSGDGYGAVEPEEAERTVLRALDIGMSLIDTSDAYGGGKTEAMLGRILEGKDAIVLTRGGTDRLTEPPTQSFAPEHLEPAVGRSLKRMRRERIDLYLLHNPGTETLRKGEATDAVKAMVKAGKIAHWGAAVAYNLFHSHDLHVIAGDVMVAGAGVLARSTLGYGLLAGMWTRDREFPQGDHRRERWTKLELARRIEQLDAVRFLVKRDVQSMRAAAIRFVLANHLVAAAVLGPRSVVQLEQLIREVGSGPTYLPEVDLAALPRALSRFGIAT